MWTSLVFDDKALKVDFQPSYQPLIYLYMIFILYNTGHVFESPEIIQQQYEHSNDVEWVLISHMYIYVSLHVHIWVINILHVHICVITCIYMCS